MVRLTTIYTRTGDSGTTGLVDGSRLAKDAPRIEAVGTVDELNSCLGLAILAIKTLWAADLTRIQNDLFDLGADLATPGEDFEPTAQSLRIVASQTEWLEQRIDEVNATLDPLRSFVLPGGNETAARLHLARAIARRAERRIATMAQTDPVNPAARAYINRLSDFLFVLARAVNASEAGDVLWKPGANR
ncbi:cob(I)yrinic acid a,c-diamide adenosyltransferase [Altererythrobacter xixiisoli]|uniref:Corrinoid adenosyltransferase n=1 Tax=Croceibacterium xixiisoli TaxID=1476466 RepID=A0A6I4TZQ6_9SPHN|nr:cob(I)yrinic acid a,c-diamide adenosyltransferase [Croceibacterium xixiisoli]MXP00168.1 cob(I)yrinic acid a,c-diamide adenosyltransferase [Croceibacterium xixiisoli]